MAAAALAFTCLDGATALLQGKADSTCLRLSSRCQRVVALQHKGLHLSRCCWILDAQQQLFLLPSCHIRSACTSALSRSSVFELPAGSQLHCLQGHNYTACSTGVLPSTDAPCELGAVAADASGSSLTSSILACPAASCLATGCPGQCCPTWPALDILQVGSAAD